MRDAKIAIVVATMWKEAPMIFIFDENSTEEQIVGKLIEDGYAAVDLEVQPTTITELNECTGGQIEFALSHQTIKVN